jgi:hypothetical protein
MFWRHLPINRGIKMYLEGQDDPDMSWTDAVD